MAKPVKPEPKFFLRDDVYALGLEHYSRTWFGGANDGRVAGEKTTDYLESAAAARRIAHDVPGVKLIFILREPASRAYSNYLWTRMNGFESEDFATAIRLEAERERTIPAALKFARPYAYFSRGLYLDLLEPYLALFPRHQMLVLRFEDIITAADQVAVLLHEFLGVACRPNDVDGLGVVNASEKPADDVPVEALRDLRERYLEPNRRLAAVFGNAFLWNV